MTKQSKQLDCCLDLVRRLPPQNIEKNLSDLIEVSPPELLEELLATIDQPLKVAICKETKQQYLLCDYNRDGDSYRSPWSSKYDPPLEDGAQPSPQIRKLEIETNNAFNRYRELYFEGGLSSAYLWDHGKDFSGVVLIKKNGEGSRRVKGCWDSIHVIEVNEKKQGKTSKCNIRLTSNIILWLENTNDNHSLNLAGNLTRQSTMNVVINKDNTYVESIGSMIEDMENKMRQMMADIYFGKIKDICSSLRSNKSLVDDAKWKDVTKDLAAHLPQKKYD